MEAMITLLTVRFVPFFLILWIISQSFQDVNPLSLTDMHLTKQMSP